MADGDVMIGQGCISNSLTAVTRHKAVVSSAAQGKKVLSSIAG